MVVVTWYGGGDMVVTWWSWHGGDMVVMVVVWHGGDMVVMVVTWWWSWW
jgi:hypothetical protein